MIRLMRHWVGFIRVRVLGKVLALVLIVGVLVGPILQEGTAGGGATQALQGTLGKSRACFLCHFGLATAEAAAVPLASLKTVPVPVPSNLMDFVQDRTSAIQLGKALFWDMQVGGDGKQACASCHFQAGADNRSKNQLSPGLLSGDTTFQTGGPNATLAPSNFPFHKLLDPNNAQSTVIADSNDVVSSQGVLRRDFSDIVDGSQIDNCNHVADPVFHVGSINTRRVEPRNTPSVINAAYNFRNFWDGRANNSFNGANPFGPRDVNARVWKVVNGSLQQVPVNIPNASLASQAVGPPGSFFEMSCLGRPFEAIGHKLLNLNVVPLANQLVAQDDSVLGPLAKSATTGGGPGLQMPYAALVAKAFRPEYYVFSLSLLLSGVNLTAEQKHGMDLILSSTTPASPNLQFNQMEANFGLFFGLAVQLYESTLIANDAPVDRYLEGTTIALTPQQQQGLAIFQGQGRCINCHGGPELTNASVSKVTGQRLERMLMGDRNVAVYDDGFYNTAVRPTTDDKAVGGKDPWGNPLSETRLCEQQLQQGLTCDANVLNIVANPTDNIPAAPLQPNERVATDGAFKTPGLRNVELTGPYFHDGGQVTLRQVVDFYNRGGDFGAANSANLDPDMVPLGLSEDQKNALVSFMLGLTDERVRWEKAPFDHPALCVPNGASGDQNSVMPTALASYEAQDEMKCLPAVGAGGNTTALQPFLNMNQFQP